MVLIDYYNHGLIQQSPHKASNIKTRSMKYLEKRKGDLYVSKNVPISSNGMIILSYKVDKEKLLENEDYEELIELQKMKHFSMQCALEFWDNFDSALYTKILKAKKQ